MIAFGPVPSRRLGRSLGINNIPHKNCTYSCVYCQVGRTRSFQVERRNFYAPEMVLKEVQEKVTKTREFGETIDYLTFVPDGEPTLDLYLDRTIELLRPLGIRIAVITNGSLIWRQDVRKALMETDWVSFKVDSTIESVWRKTNRPHKSLQLGAILDGILEFRNNYSGTLSTETMFVRNTNDGEENLTSISDFLGRLNPEISYLSIPIRPPAEKWVRPPGEEVIARTCQIIGQRVDHVEYLIGYEGNAFAFTGNPEQDLLSIMAVHPMREDAVAKLLQKASADWAVVQRLVDKGLLINTEYKGQTFYMRKFFRGDKLTSQ